MSGQNAPTLIVLHSISLPEGNYGTDYVRQLFVGELDCDVHSSFKDLRELRVSAHLFIRRDAEILQFVPFNVAAWHAGISSYMGRENCNDFSVGIELEGSPEDTYTEEQYECLAGICNRLFAQYPGLSPERLVGHKDIAPGRKDDPWNMDWEKLKRQLGKNAQPLTGSR